MRLDLPHPQRRNTLAVICDPQQPSPGHKRAYSQSALPPPTITEAIYPRKPSPLTLPDLPTEILEQILSYCIRPAENAKVIISRRPTLTDTTPSTIHHHSTWSVQGYPYALLLINRRVSAIAFSLLWRSTAFILSLSPADALCFLAHTLSPRQRAALRRIRLTRFMLSVQDAVGDDIWLGGGRRPPAFLAMLEGPVRGGGEPGVPRVECLVARLQAFQPAVSWVC